MHVPLRKPGSSQSKETSRPSRFHLSSHLIVLIVRTDQSTAHTGDAINGKPRKYLQRIAFEEKFVLLRRSRSHIT